jgi:hypothetical protein
MHPRRGQWQAQFLDAGHFGGETDAARAVNAAVMIVLTSGPIYLSRPRACSPRSAIVDAIGHGLVLQVALAALIADRAIQRVVDEQELHHPFAGLLDHRRVGGEISGGSPFGPGRRSRTPMAQDATGLGAALHLDQAHAAVAGDRQPLVIAKARNLGTGLLTRLQAACSGPALRSPWEIQSSRSIRPLNCR